MAAFLLRRRTTQLPHFTEPRYLFRFTACAVLAAPGCRRNPVRGSLLAMDRTLLVSLSSWITTDGLGTAIVAPHVFLFSHRNSGNRRRWKPTGLFGGLIPVALVSFCQARVPVIFLIYPTVALILFRLGLGWAPIATLFRGCRRKLVHHSRAGTIRADRPCLSRGGPTILLQLYIAIRNVSNLRRRFGAGYAARHRASLARDRFASQSGHREFAGT